MTTIRLAVNELRRMTAGRLPMLATLALILVPLIYGSMYLYANYDPYAKLDKIPAALVVADKGAQNGGKQLNAGKDVADDLLKSGKFQWHRVDAKEAAAGVRDGRYTFSLTMPEDFSAALTSSAQLQPRQSLLQLTTNDANNYLAGTIADKVVETVRAAVSRTVGTEAADRLLLGFSSTHEKLTEAAAGAKQLAVGAHKASDGSSQLVKGADTLESGQTTLVTGTKNLASGASQLSNGLNTLKDKTATLPADTTKLASGAKQVADGNATAADTGKQVADAASKFTSGLDDTRAKIKQRMEDDGAKPDQVNAVLALLDQGRGPIDDANSKIQDSSQKLTKLASGAQQVSDGAATLADSAPDLTNGITTASTAASKLEDGATTLQAGQSKAADGTTKLVSGATELNAGNGALATGADKLQKSLASGLGQIPNPSDKARQDTARTIGDPVAVQSVGDAKASTYGAGLAPFFLALATWIGAFALFLLLKPLSSRALAAGAPAWRVALGGWLPAAVLGILQVAAMYVTVALAVGVTPAKPVATFGLLALTALCFTAMVHGLNAWLGAIGKFVALILLVVQLVSAGGTFPWQTLPDALYPLHLILPMGYAVDGLRHLLYGGSLSGMPLDVGMLVLWGLIGIGMGVFAARRNRVWTAERLRPELAL